MSHPFEARVPFDCILELIQIVRSGQLVEKKFEAIQHAAWFIGCSAESLKNKPPVFSELPEIEEDLTDEQIADELATYVPVADAPPGEDAAAIDPATLITIISLVLRLLASRKK